MSVKHSTMTKKNADAKPSNLKREDLRAVTQHARWVVEYLSAASNEMLGRSATLIGFLAIELSFVASWKPSDFNNVHHYKWFYGAGLVLAVSSVSSLIYAGKSKYFIFPDFTEVNAALADAKGAKKKPLDALLYKNAGEDMFDQLINENRHISKWYQRGLKYLSASQIAFVTLLIIHWYNTK